MGSPIHFSATNFLDFFPDDQMANFVGRDGSTSSSMSTLLFCLFSLQEIHSLPTKNSVGNINNSVGN